MSNIFTIKVNGVLYENFTSSTLFRSLDNAVAEFLFTASNTFRQSFPFSKGDICEIYIDDNKMLTGYINTVGGSYDAESHELTIAGRCKTQDIVDCSINGSVALKSGIRLEDIIKKILKLNNLSDIKVINNVDIKPFTRSEFIAAEVGENAFDFIERYCRKRQVLFTTNEDGDIVLTRAGTNKYSTYLKNQLNSLDNNILRAQFEDSDQERFNTYIVYSQSTLLSRIINNAPEISKSKPILDNAIRSSRVLQINSNMACDRKTNTDRASWESNLRRTRQFQYNCRIRGFYLDASAATLIKPNNIITVSDAMLGVNSDLLIKSCRYIKSLQGTFTDIELVNKDSYTLKAQQDEIEARFDVRDDILWKLGI